MRRKITSVRKNNEFIKIYRSGKSLANRLMIMYCAPSKVNNAGEHIDRIGISVSKKVGNSVVRHRVKRLIRESYRLNRDDIRKGFDIIVVARPDCKGKTYAEIESAFKHMIKLHHLRNEKVNVIKPEN